MQADPVVRETPVQEAQPFVAPNASSYSRIPPKVRKKPFYKRPWFWIIIGFVLIVGIIANLGDNAENPANEQGETTSSVSNVNIPSDSTVTTSSTTTSIQPITQIIENWEITVKFVEINRKIGRGLFSKEADDGSTFLIVNLEVKNIGTEQEYFLSIMAFKDDLSAIVKYADRYEYPPNQLLGISDDLAHTSINPLEKKSGLVAFSIAEEAAVIDDLVLIFKQGSEEITYSLIEVWKQP